jgi:hypothetical protein
MEEIELDFGAISVDNATLKGEGYKFNEGLLKQMCQFESSPVRVIQTDIVHNEAVKHIGDEISKARASVDQVLRSAEKHLKIDSDKIQNARDLLSVKGDNSSIASQRLEEFYRWIGAEVIKSSEHIDFDQLMEMYFGTKAPFESGKDKKNEFPDAIALLSLEKWAEQNSVNVIAVSPDKGWKCYSDNSNRITVISSLSEALEKFLPHNKVSSIISHIREDWILDEKNHILDQIEQAIIESIDRADINVEASSSFYYDYEDVFATYIEHQLLSDQSGLVAINIVRIEEDSIVLRVCANVACEVEASFDFFVRDSIDRDYVSLGSLVCSTKESYDTDILITLTGDFSQGFEDIKVSEIEVLETIGSADFGEIEPDWRGHDDYL